jgi:hypothetical protein
MRNTGRKGTRPDGAPGIDGLLERVDGLIARRETMLPPAPPPVAWEAGIAFRWRKRGGRGLI